MQFLRKRVVREVCGQVSYKKRLIELLKVQILSTHVCQEKAEGCGLC